MAKIEEMGTVIDLDILVVGHGIAGFNAAVAAKESGPDLRVMAVDKGSIGYAGKFNKGGGALSFIPEGGEETYVEYHVKNCGDYLNDQDMIRKYAYSTISTVDRMETWGAKFIGRDKAFSGHPLIPWKMFVVDGDWILKMLPYARKIGVEFMDKISVVDLIMEDGVVAGAIGFSLLDGECFIFKAKAVILANGNQNFRVLGMWSCARGDGIAAAYRAGAKMRNAEFGSFINIINAETKAVSYNAENALYDAEGNFISEGGKNLPENLKGAMGGVDIGGAQSVMMYLAAREGRGPIYENCLEGSEDFAHSPHTRNMHSIWLAPEPGWERPYFQKFHHLTYFKNKKGAHAQDTIMHEVLPGLVAELSPLYADHNMASNLPGLFSAGDISGNGSAWAGAVPTPPGKNRGSGLMAASFTGQLAGDSAAKYVYGVQSDIIINPTIVEKLKNDIYAPLNRYEGVTPDEITWDIKNAMQPLEYSGYKTEERMKEAWKLVMDAKEKLPQVVAKDWHYLSAANECRSAVLGAELFYKASMERKESRGWHMREDYKERDDKNFLKWIILQDKDGEMEVSYEDLPMDTYKYKPEGWESK